MQTSRFQLGLIATLAAALGFTFASSKAIGYPAGGAVSMGANPIASFGGSSSSGGTVSIGPAPADQDLIITDVNLTGHGVHSSYHACKWTISLQSETGTTLGAFKIWSQVAYYNYTAGGGHVSAQLQSGVRVPAGESLSLVLAQDSGGSSCNVAYTLSGYYAQP